MTNTTDYNGTLSTRLRDIPAAIRTLDPDATKPATHDLADTFRHLLHEVTETTPTEDDLHQAGDLITIPVYGYTTLPDAFDAALRVLAPYIVARIEASSRDGMNWLLVVSDGDLHNIPGAVVYEGESDIAYDFAH